MFNKLTKKELPGPWTQAFPAYKGRRFRLEVRRQVGLSGYWDGGSKSSYVAISLTDGTCHEANRAVENPHCGAAHQSLPLNPGYVLAEHVRYCGEDLGIVFHIHPDALALIGGNRVEDPMAKIYARLFAARTQGA